MAHVTRAAISSAGTGEATQRASEALSGYLCGTERRGRPWRRADTQGAGQVAALHRGVFPMAAPDSLRLMLGEQTWVPDEHAGSLRDRLMSALTHPEMIELILFGSQVRGTATGFSDVDAILVITDVAAEDPGILRALRPRVLAALRAVVAHQPMQQHGFCVLTPKLLMSTEEALAMPAAALAENRSLRGIAVAAHFSPAGAPGASRALVELGKVIGAAEAWPSHPRGVHRIVSAFEDLPPLYLWAHGTPMPKWRSFELVFAALGESSSPYDVLLEVRERWPRQSAPMLRAMVVLLRNPWLALDLWSLLPRSVPEPPRSLLSAALLEELRRLGRQMVWRELASARVRAAAPPQPRTASPGS